MRLNAHPSSLLALVFAITACSACSGQRNGLIMPDDRRADNRLESTISIASDRMPLARLLERMSAASKVVLKMNDKDPLSGAPIFVRLTDVPLADAMNAVWSLLGYHAAPWRWIPDGTPGKLSYVLEPTAAARALAGRLRAEARSLYDDHVKTMMRIAGMNPADRKAQAKEVGAQIAASLLLPGADMQENASIGFLWEGLNLLSQLPQGEQDTVIHGTTSITIPFEKLSPAGHAFLKNYMDYTRPGHPDTPDYTRPESVTYSAAYIQGITPTLMVYPGKFAGMSFLGGPGLDMGLANRFGAGWLLDGDTASNPKEKVRVPKPSSPQSSLVRPVVGSRIIGNIRELTVCLPLNVLAMLDDESLANPDPPYGKLLADHLTMLRADCLVQRKWWGEVLLLRTSRRFVDEDINIPYSLTKLLAKDGIIGSRFMTLQDFATMFATISQRQLERLANQYVTVREAARFAPLFTYYLRDRDLGRTGGAGTTPDLLDALRRTGSESVLATQAERVRMRSEDDTLGDAPVRRIIVEYMLPDRHWHAIPGLRSVQFGGRHAD